MRSVRAQRPVRERPVSDPRAQSPAPCHVAPHSDRDGQLGVGGGFVGTGRFTAVGTPFTGALALRAVVGGLMRLLHDPQGTGGQGCPPDPTGKACPLPINADWTIRGMSFRLKSMRLQNQIKRKLAEGETIEWVRGRLAEGDLGTRTALARAVCCRWDFRDRRGQPQLAGCLKGLRELEEEGKFRLPAASRRQGGPQARRLRHAVEEPKEVPRGVGQVRGLRLVEVRDEAESRIWNELMIREHPQGERPLVGRQLRYLIGSDHGWLGALGFASAALQLSARDRWIGWDGEQRRASWIGSWG